MGEQKPLVLDVDGTFLRTDLLVECFWGGLGKDPGAVLRSVWSNWNNRAELKSELAEIAAPDLTLMPVDPTVKAMAEAGQAQGRDVVLASASDIILVRELSQIHELSPTVFGSENGVNLAGAAKAGALEAAFGAGGFHYAGDEMRDLAVWKSADEAILVGALPKAKAELDAVNHPVTQISRGWHWADLIRALRPHQYVKNSLLLLPLLAAHEFALMSLLQVVLGIIAFSAAASTIYIINDLLDLEADRLHIKKKHRPLASGAVPLMVGMKTAVVLAVTALLLAAVLNWAFFGIVVLYMILSLAYSLKLKRMRWVDISMLATLYTVRVVAGAAAAEVFVSSYMLIFVFPVFLTLGCVKRLTELTLAKSDERLPGRGYGRPDRPDLLNIAGIGMVGALVVFFLYSFTEQAQSLYATQWLLWVALLPIGGWLFRMISLGYQGKQDYDPIVFALRDRHGISLIIFTLTLLFYASGLFQNAFGA